MSAAHCHACAPILMGAHVLPPGGLVLKGGPSVCSPLPTSPAPAMLPLLPGTFWQKSVWPSWSLKEWGGLVCMVRVPICLCLEELCDPGPRQLLAEADQVHTEEKDVQFSRQDSGPGCRHAGRAPHATSSAPAEP
ncbi:hypothetical protein HJG60_009530 [Phyllostomus discolor]|uniref:Uncharacterized protein n=1 Tax=Phyllostomus discolor TaxID=89673 RepID=A0A833YLH4_9CHIR|nr:hypothetical protein HJG60_009530 [Phyllostomus discolor]